MKKLLIFTLVQLSIFQVNFDAHSQQFSKAVRNFIEVEAPVIAITNVTLIDGTGSPALTGQDILITGDKITAIGASGAVSIPKNARIIDGINKTVIAGLVMLHEHLFYGKPLDGSYKATPMPFTFPQMYVAGGVTTMRTAGSFEANTDLNVKNLVKQGQMLGPKMDITTAYIEREGSIPQARSLSKDESPEKTINFWLDKGATSVKVYNHITKGDLKKVIKTAHNRNTKVTGHLCSITYREAAELGIDNLEHGFMVASDFIKNKKENHCDNGLITQSLSTLDENSPELKSLMEFLIEKNVTLTYTPNVFEPCAGREVIPGGGEVALAPYLLEQATNICKTLVDYGVDSNMGAGFEKEKKRIKKFYEMGGKLVVGTDPTGTGRVIAGYANQRTIELLVETGFTIEEAIQIASLNGAKYLEQDKEIGSVEVGKIADLVLIDGDLSKDVSNIRNMEIVFKNGIGYNSKKIFESVKGKVGLY